MSDAMKLLQDADGRLGVGEFRSPVDGEDSAVEHARWIFLDRAAAVKPALLYDLEAGLLPLYRECVAFLDQIAPECRIEWAWLGRLESPTPLSAPEHQAGAEHLLNLRTSLEAWGELHGLAEPWVRDAALATLDAWRRVPTPPTRLEWVHGSLPVADDPAAPAPFLFRFPPWLPAIQPRESYVERLRQSFEELFAEYMARADGRMRERGHVRALRKSNPEHFDWLAHVHVGRVPYPDLAARVHKGRVTVQEAVQRAAEFVGVDLSPPRPRGRPRKKTVGRPRP
jgi:hypothetical protein